MKPRPTDQPRRDDLAAVVCKRHERRKHDGHDVEDADEHKGQREREKIELLIEQRLTALQKVFDAVALCDLARRVDDVLDIGIVRKRKQQHEKDRRDTPRQHGDGIIPLDPHDGHALRCAERKEPDDVLDARKDKKENKSDLQKHEQRALRELTAKELPQPHKHAA